MFLAQRLHTSRWQLLTQQGKGPHSPTHNPTMQPLGGRSGQPRKAPVNSIISVPARPPPPFPVLKSDWSRDRPSLSPEDSRTSPLMSVSLCWSPQIPTFTHLRSVALYGGACSQLDHVTGTVHGHLRKPGREPMDYSQCELVRLRLSSTSRFQGLAHHHLPNLGLGRLHRTGPCNILIPPR